MAGGSIFNTWQFAFQYGGLKKTHTHNKNNKNKTRLSTVILLGCLEGNGVGEVAALGRQRVGELLGSYCGPGEGCFLSV